MKIRRQTIGHFLLVLFTGVFLTDTCFAEVPAIGGSINGFGKLTWGMSVEQAKKAYPDLYFGGYEIVDRKEEPVKIYYRSGSPEKIDGVVFDSYEYWFRGEGFSMVRASLHSKFGPRTLVTRAETSWIHLAESLVRKYGAPKEHSTRYVTEYLVVVKEMRWVIGGVFLHLKYKGSEEGNEDHLIFEMGK